MLSYPLDSNSSVIFCSHGRSLITKNYLCGFVTAPIYRGREQSLIGYYFEEYCLQFLRRLLFSKYYSFQFIIRLLFSNSTLFNLSYYYSFQKSILFNLSDDYYFQNSNFSIFTKKSHFKRVPLKRVIFLVFQMTHLFRRVIFRFSND